mgnify:CR=1 FL=1
MREHGKCDILKSARGAAEELKHGVLADRNGGGEVLGLELSGVGRMDELRHFLMGEVRQQRAEDFHRHALCGERQAALPVKAKPLQIPHGVKAAVRRKAVENGLGARGAKGGISGALIFHQ